MMEHKMVKYNIELHIINSKKIKILSDMVIGRINHAVFLIIIILITIMTIRRLFIQILTMVSLKE